MHYENELNPSMSDKMVSDNISRKSEHAIVIDIQKYKIQIAVVRENSLIIGNVHTIKRFADTKCDYILNVIALYNPGLIILDGPIIQSHFKTIHSLIIKYIKSSLFKKNVPEIPEIRMSKNEGYAPIIGMGQYVIKLYRDSTNDVKDMTIPKNQWYFSLE